MVCKDIGFASEIQCELEQRGIECRMESRCGMGCLMCRTGDKWRGVLAVPVCAMNVEDAERRSLVLRAVLENEEDLVVVPEDLFRSRRDMMVYRVLAHLGLHWQVYARTCEIRRIDREVAREFLSRTHTYGDASCRYCYGVYLGRYTGRGLSEGMAAEMPGVRPEHGMLVAAAEFSNARRWKKSVEVRSYEWVRYASLPNVRVCGGMGKVLRKFIEEVSPDDVMTYADLEWSCGGVYRTLGFVPEGEKSAVNFVVDPADWKRRAIGKVAAGTESCLFYTNLGSRKYRLKLTDYE